MSDLLRRLERGPSMLAQEEAADRIRELEDLLEECEQALVAINLDNGTPSRFSKRIHDIIHTTLAKLRAAQETSDD